MSLVNPMLALKRKAEEAAGPEKFHEKTKEALLDHMGSTELAANLFRATQTEEKLRREQTKGKNRANDLHFEVGKRVRQTIRDLGGTMPENLPPAENIEKVAKRLKKAALAALPLAAAAGASIAHNDLKAVLYLQGDREEEIVGG